MSIVMTPPLFLKYTDSIIPILPLPLNPQPLHSGLLRGLGLHTTRLKAYLGIPGSSDAVTLADVRLTVGFYVV